MKKAALVVSMLLLLLCPSASAQQRDAAPGGEQKMTLTGVLYDINGAVIITGASVVAESAGGQKYESATDEDGFYRFELPLAVYKIRASAPGFCPREYADFKVVASTHGKMALDFVLEVADKQSSCWPGSYVETAPKRKRKKPGIVIE